MKDQKIIELFEKSLTKKVISITDSSNGLDQEVKIIETKNNKYVIKIPNEKVILHREIFAHNILNGIIPVPNIIFKSDYFLIQDYITGESLDKTNLSKNNFRKDEEFIEKNGIKYFLIVGFFLVIILGYFLYYIVNIILR